MSAWQVVGAVLGLLAAAWMAARFRPRDRALSASVAEVLTDCVVPIGILVLAAAMIAGRLP